MRDRERKREEREIEKDTLQQQQREL